MKNNNNKLSRLIKISLLGAIAFILMYFDFPIPGFPPFLKIDLSEIPVLIGGFALGPVAGIMIELIKNIIYVLIKGTSSAFVGEFANFAIGAVWVFTASYIYSRKRTRGNAIKGLVLGIILMTAFASILNYFVLLPMYTKLFHMDLGNINVFIASAIIPFNLIKGAVVSVGTLALYKSMAPFIKGEAIKTIRKTT